MSGHAVVPVRVYVSVFVALLALTWTTWYASTLELGKFNTLVALTIAVSKMTLVVWFFMHVRSSSSLTKVTILAGFFWLLLLMAFTQTDESTRYWTETPSGWGAATSAPVSNR